MGELVELSKISHFMVKQHRLQPLYKCTHVGEERITRGQMRALTTITGARVFSVVKEGGQSL